MKHISRGIVIQNKDGKTFVWLVYQNRTERRITKPTQSSLWRIEKLIERHVYPVYPTITKTEIIIGIWAKEK